MTRHLGNSPKIPVLALTGFLGAGKTTVLNHLLRAPGVRAGVIINDFGAINIDSALVEGQIDDAASIAGGCLCCMPDSGGLDKALHTLARPELHLDAIIIEASGVAEPLALARILRDAMPGHVRLGGMIDVVDAAEYFSTVDIHREAPTRFAVSTLVIINKTDHVAAAERENTIRRITDRIRERNPYTSVIATSHGSVDPRLIFDIADPEDPTDQLPLAALIRSSSKHVHHHADSVTVVTDQPVDPFELVELLENPPAGVYRIKGLVRVPTPHTSAYSPSDHADRWIHSETHGTPLRRYAVHTVGHHIHVDLAPENASPDGLVAIGMSLDRANVTARLKAVTRATGPHPKPDAHVTETPALQAELALNQAAPETHIEENGTRITLAQALRRLERYRQLSVSPRAARGG